MFLDWVTIKTCCGCFYSQKEKPLMNWTKTVFLLVCLEPIRHEGVWAWLWPVQYVPRKPFDLVLNSTPAPPYTGTFLCYVPRGLASSSQSLSISSLSEAELSSKRRKKKNTSKLKQNNLQNHKNTFLSVRAGASTQRGATGVTITCRTGFIGAQQHIVSVWKHPLHRGGNRPSPHWWSTVRKTCQPALKL